MKIQRKMPVLEVVQYKKGMETGWCTSNQLKRWMSGSSYTYFAYADNENAQELAEKENGKKEANPYWEFGGKKIVKPKHNKYYFVDERGVVRAYTKAELKEKFNIIEE